MKSIVKLTHIFCLITLYLSFSTGCKKESYIKYSKGIFPDSVIDLINLNSEYDDYNTALFSIEGVCPVIFSSNRGSKGAQFDLVQGVISFGFDQETGFFSLNSDITNDIYYGTIISKANTAGNDFGPYSYFSSNDGYEYFILASETNEHGLDFFFLKSLPRFENAVPNVSGLFPVNVINTRNNEAYISFDFNGDSVYFCSDRNGDYDIFVQKRNLSVATDLFLSGSFESASVVDSINSTSNDKTPFVYMNIMVYSSDRPGGMGGYDLYYSVFRNGKWSSPVNLGPKVNTEYNEYRPVIINHQDFVNQAIIFSSDRLGGKGGFDLYLAGFSLPVSRITY